MIFRPAGIRPAAAALACLLLMAGCASTPRQANNDAIARTQTSSSRDTGVKPAPQAPPTRTSQQPAGSLWRRIDNGLALEPNRHRPAVRKWIQFYTGHRKHLLGAARRARPFLWHIVQAIDERGMPMEIALLPIVESGFKPSAISYASAAGIWQFMPGTAKRFGLTHSWWFDGRRDVLGSTTAALDYLEWLHGRFDDWLLALAAYNAGEGRIDGALAAAERNGRRQDFWHLDLPRETGDYVPKLLALRELLSEPQRFALQWPSLPDRPVTELVTLPGQVALSVAADMMDMPVTTLERINPGVRRGATDPNGAHRLLVPADRAGRLRTALAENKRDLMPQRHHRVVRGDSLGSIANHYGTRVSVLRRANGLTGSIIHPGDTLIIPNGAHPPPADATPTVAQPERRYTVRAGDSLWEIAHRSGVQVAALRRWNGLSSHSMLQPGQTLTIRGGNPATKSYRYQIASGDSLWRIAQAQEVSIDQLRRWNNLPQNATLHPGQTLVIRGAVPTEEPFEYQVQSGDSLWQIAHAHGVSVHALRGWNNLSKNATLQPGQTLVLRAGTQQRSVVYHVQAGDSLWSIAHHFQVHVAQIKNWNDLGGDGFIRPGQKLRIIMDATG